MRGDLKTRIEAIAKAVNSGLLTPNEGRALDNRPPMDGGDVLLIQGATVPLSMAGTAFANLPAPDDVGNAKDPENE
jgi:hypothetical protein